MHIINKNRMRKNLKYFLPISIILTILIVYFTMTPVGALRFKILTLGYTISAFTFEIMDDAYPMEVKKNQIAYSLENEPFEEISQGELTNWIVTKHGIFYIANFYGWG